MCCVVSSGGGCSPESFPCCVSRNDLSLAVLGQGTKKFLSFSCLQMGHACKSELDSPIKSENSDFQSPPDWNSSSDVDVMSWRTAEEVTMGKPEGSSQEQETDLEMELSEPLWEDDSEDDQEAQQPSEGNSVFQFLLEVGLFGLQEGGQHSSDPPETLGFSGSAPSIQTETAEVLGLPSPQPKSSLSSHLELPLHPGSCFAKTQLTLKHRNVSELTL